MWLLLSHPSPSNLLKQLSLRATIQYACPLPSRTTPGSASAQIMFFHKGQQWMAACLMAQPASRRALDRTRVANSFPPKIIHIRLVPFYTQGYPTGRSKSIHGKTNGLTYLGNCLDRCVWLNRCLCISSNSLPRNDILKNARGTLKGPAFKHQTEQKAEYYPKAVKHTEWYGSVPADPERQGITRFYPTGKQRDPRMDP